MTNIEEKDPRIRFLNEIKEFSKTVDKLAEDLLQPLRSQDSSILDPIKPTIEPKKNATLVMEFYNAYLNAVETFKKVESKIKSAGISAKAAESKLEIKDLEEHNVLELLSSFIKNFDGLEKYASIKIVEKLVMEKRQVLDEYLEIIRKTVIGALKRLPNVVDGVDKYSKFLLRQTNSKQYIIEYMDICQSRLALFKIEESETAILQQTKDLTHYFNMVKELNVRLLGKKHSKLTKEGLILMLVLDLKGSLGTYLAKIEKSSLSSHIPFLIQLYSRIKHGDEEMVDELEHLFELKPEIMKLIFNCFIQFFGELDLLQEPNKEFQSEEIVNVLSETLKEFSLNKEAKRVWVSSFGTSFGVYQVEDLDENFCEKCLLKITELAEQLELKYHAIYTINNVHSLQKYFLRLSGLEVKQLIYKNCETIVGVFRIGLESKSPTEAYTYLSETLLADKKYYLPDEERNYVAKKLKTMIEDGASKKIIQGNPRTLLDLISEIYTGKDE